MISIRPAQKTDWIAFYSLATAEGWNVPRTERQLFEAPWSEFAWALNMNGVFGGLVTAVAHERSGWIGNLIVPPYLRGQGYGVKLFQAALADLINRGLSTYWLTASESGRRIYEKAGFVAVDQIERWVYLKRIQSESKIKIKPDATEKLWDCDRKVWGENRLRLLESLAVDGQAFYCGDAVALLQRGRDVQILGPWYSPSSCPHVNRVLLRDILLAADPGIALVIDLMGSSPFSALLAAAGFKHTGKTALMMKGASHTGELREMVSLASLGSFG